MQYEFSLFIRLFVWPSSAVPVSHISLLGKLIGHHSSGLMKGQSIVSEDSCCGDFFFSFDWDWNMSQEKICTWLFACFRRSAYIWFVNKYKYKAKHKKKIRISGFLEFPFIMCFVIDFTAFWNNPTKHCPAFYLCQNGHRVKSWWWCKIMIIKEQLKNLWKGLKLNVTVNFYFCICIF